MEARDASRCAWSSASRSARRARRGRPAALGDQHPVDDPRQQRADLRELYRAEHRIHTGDSKRPPDEGERGEDHDRGRERRPGVAPGSRATYAAVRRWRRTRRPSAPARKAARCGARRWSDLPGSREVTLSVVAKSAWTPPTAECRRCPPRPLAADRGRCPRRRFRDRARRSDEGALGVGAGIGALGQVERLTTPAAHAARTARSCRAVSLAFTVGPGDRANVADTMLVEGDGAAIELERLRWRG